MPVGTHRVRHVAWWTSLHLLVLCLPRAAAAQGGGPFRIAGRVLDAADGRPVQHARVSLTPPNGQPGPQRETESGEDGGFSFPGLPAGKYTLQGEAHGYIGAAYDEHEQYSSAIVTGAGLPTGELRLQLQPAALWSGRVTDDAGEPVRDATVTLFRENTEDGVRKVTRFRDGRTDDRGLYEVTRLPPGTYFACVQAQPWYATFPPVDPPGGNMGIVASVDPALSVVYPLTFYPAATAADGASPVVLRAGDRFHADFQLTATPSLRLSVQMPAEADGQPGRFLLLERKVFDTVEPVPLQRVHTVGSTTEVDGLSPGTYMLRPQRRGAQPGSAQEVTLASGSLSVDSTQPPVFGKVTLVAGPVAGKLPQTLRLVLRRNVPPASTEVVTLKDGKAEFTNVEPGDYRVEVLNTRWHVDAVALGGKTQPGARLHVTGEAETATIALGAGTVRVTGFVRRGGRGVSGAMVVLVPAGGDGSVELYRRDQSDLDGSFLLGTVVPGNYLLVAISDGWSLEWGRPEALAPYLSQAVPVTVPAGGPEAMNIGEPVPAQTR